VSTSTAGPGNGSLHLTFYGDDFTGSTDALEALTLAGLRTVLFLDCPTPEVWQQFPGLGAAGVAGFSRVMTPAQMDVTLPGVFSALRALGALGAKICHYKVCSTFDSSPEIGNIGRAIEIGRRVFAPPFVPVVVGLPKLGRYCAFGNLFARSGAESPVYRLDRHPTMRHHPVTPMTESDLRLHLARQTDVPVSLFDATQLDGPPAQVDAAFAALLEHRPPAVLFDVMHEGHLATIGRLLDRQATGDSPLFVAGSSAVEYALTAYWHEAGLLATTPAVTPAWMPRVIAPVSQMVVVSGSCSPVTDRQIGHAIDQGFVEVPLQPDLLVDPERALAEQERAVRAALDAVSRGASVILHTCRGPADPRITTTGERLDAMGQQGLGAKLETGARLGRALGAILLAVLERAGLRRATVVGGDTSSYVARQLGLLALEMIAPAAPGAPLCRAYAPGTPLDGLEIVFKGGQNGRQGFFSSVLRGDPG
jgi:3-oxoisoapionate kinase